MLKNASDVTGSMLNTTVIHKHILYCTLSIEDAAEKTCTHAIFAILSIGTIVMLISF